MISLGRVPSASRNLSPMSRYLTVLPPSSSLEMAVLMSLMRWRDGAGAFLLRGKTPSSSTLVVGESFWISFTQAGGAGGGFFSVVAGGVFWPGNREGGFGVVPFPSPVSRRHK